MDMEVFTARGSRMSAIRAFILARIADPALCLADIAAHQGISSSYVRKLFASEGAKFSTYVLDLRLGQVQRLLTDPDARLHPISVIAARCGFNDISYFNRAFRKRYGCTPSALRAGRHTSEAGLDREDFERSPGFAEPVTGQPDRG